MTKAVSVRAGVIVLAVAALVAALVYVVAHRLPPTYQSSALFRVTVPNQAGVNDSVVTAANDLATQYSQLADAPPVLSAAAVTLRVPTSSLSGDVAGDTLNAQNLVQVTASAGTPATAEARARATVNATVNYIDTINGQQSSTYATNASRSLVPLNGTLARVSRRLTSDSAAQRSNDSVVLATLLEQRQQVLDSVATDAAAGEPTLQVISTGSSASQVTPRPSLYALIAFVIVLLISARLAYVLAQRPPRTSVARPAAWWSDRSGFARHGR